MRRWEEGVGVGAMCSGRGVLEKRQTAGGGGGGGGRGGGDVRQLGEGGLEKRQTAVPAGGGWRSRWRCGRRGINGGGRSEQEGDGVGPNANGNVDSNGSQRLTRAHKGSQRNLLISLPAHHGIIFPSAAISTGDTTSALLRTTSGSHTC